MSPEPSAESSRDDASVSLRALVGAEELRAWQEPVAWRAWCAFLSIWLQIALALGLYLAYPSWSSFAVAFVLIGGGQHALGLVGHEFVHFAVLPRNRRWNDLLGTWLFCAPVGLPLPLYRHRHFEHHRSYGTERDTKTVYRRSWRGWRMALEILRCLSGFEYAYRALESLRLDRESTAAGQPAPPASRTLPPIAVTQLVIFAAFCLVDPWLYLALWLAPLVTVYNLCNKIRASIEHQPLDLEGGADPGGIYFKGTSGAFVRSVRASWLERLFLCRINFCYHVEHHLWPQLSYQYLPEVHQRLRQHGAFESDRFGLGRTYLSTLASLWLPNERSTQT